MSCATPKRRSARLRGSSVQASRPLCLHVAAHHPNTQHQPGTPSSAKPSKLDALLETQEAMPTITASPRPKEDAVATNAKPKETATPTASKIATLTKTTPQTTGRIQPDREDMHPARFHSTVKKMATERRVGFALPELQAQGSPSASKLGQAPAAEPDNVFSSLPSLATAKREQSAELSSEAQKMMDELRANAAKYKKEILAQQRQDGPFAGRKLAQPKGKMSRYSDVHLKEFKKMDSIANHASAFRADPTRFPPAQHSLKRSNSKAGLDSDDTPASTPKRAVSRMITPRTAPAAGPNFFPSAKRVKQLDDASMPAPALPASPSVARGSGATSLPRSRGLSSASSLLTPTKSTLQRTTSTNSLVSDSPSKPSAVRTPVSKTFATPTKPAETPSKPTPAPPQIPHTVDSQKYRSGLINRLQNVKSILRRPQVRYSDDPAKIAAGTHLSTPKSQVMQPSNGNAAAAGAETLQEPGSPSHRAEKHVNFTASTNIPAPTPPAKTTGAVSSHSPGSPSPTKKQSVPAAMRPLAVSYPTLPASGEAAAAAAAPAPASPSPDYTSQPPKAIKPAGRDFTFRASSAIIFSSPLKPRTPTTPTTIRHVSGHCPATTSRLPTGSIPHGLPNKKRKHVSSSSDDDAKENRATPDDATTGGPAVKKRRLALPSFNLGKPRAAARPAAATTPSPVKARPTSTSMSSARKAPSMVPSSKIDRKTVGAAARRTGPAPAAGGVMSMSRLNALATPKKR